MAERAKSDERIHPEPPSRDPEDDESRSVWGFRDTAFQVNERGHVLLSGQRYALSGKELPELLPWARDTLGIDFDAFDTHSSRYPCAVPEPRSNPALAADLAGLLREDQIETDPLARLRHGHGHTQAEMFAIKYGALHRVPDVVAHPESESEIEALVDLASRHDTCLIPFGGGTNVTEALRCPADEARVIVSVDLRRMNRVGWIDPRNRLAEIEAGANGREIDEVLSRHGFTLGHEPDSYEFSTLGGWVATHASGMKKNRYGNIEDILVDVRVATVHGLIGHHGALPRESVGVDVRRAVIGSEGNHGIVTSAVVKIFPLPEIKKYGSVLFHDFASGVDFLEELQREGDLPASVRLVDNLQFQFGQVLKPASAGLAALKSRLERWLVTGPLAFDPKQMAACTFVFEGSEAEVAAQEKRVYRLARRHRGMKAGSSNGERGYQLTFGIAYIRDFMMEHWILAESFETSVPWSRAQELCANVKQRLWQEHAKRGLPGKPYVTCRITQLYDPGVCVYFYFAFHYKGVENASEIYEEMEIAAREEILRSGGSLSHHHGVGKLRRQFLPEISTPAALEVRRRIALAFDPDGRFGARNQDPNTPL